MRQWGKIPAAYRLDDPLALFLTWTTYGSWWPGDERGWVAKPGRFREPDAKREQAARQRMTEPELTLDAEQRDIVETTVETIAAFAVGAFMLSPHYNSCMMNATITNGP